MLIDARNLSPGKILDADICIVGAGAAGITLAMELLKTQFKVLLLESGGLKFEHPSQFLYIGESSGRTYQPLQFTRRRHFGGTTHTWFGRCRPLDAIDFEKRSYIPNSGWPFTRADMDPFYERAHSYCQLDRYDYDPDHWKAAAEENKKISSAGLETKIFQFSPPTDFGIEYHGALQQASNIQVCLHANVTGIALDRDAKTVSHLRCSTLQKKKFQVNARIFVLAAGGLEVTRLLLVSNDVQTTGIGNQNDLLGRYFMEHLHIFGGAAITSSDVLTAEFFKLNYDHLQSKLGLVKAIGIPKAAMAGDQLMNASAFFVTRPAYKASDLYYSAGVTSVIKVAEVFQHSTAPSLKPIVAAWRFLAGSKTPFLYIREILRHKLHPAYLPALYIQLETQPNPESRVMLSNKTDSLGIRKLDLRWQLTPLDLESYRKFKNLLYQGLGKLGYPIREINHDVDAQGWPVSMTGAKHHMGTTRMHTDPRQGVVDANARVHGTANLYVASSSVFPTSGMANPTLTIVALAIRLADHLKQKLG